MAQEALNNIVKHAKAESANILLAFEDNVIRVRVRDDGCGFDLSAKKGSHGGRPSLGLAGMQERAALFGGEFFISSQPGQGTLLEVILPYTQPEEVDASHDNTPAAGG
jgi:signal transduction histidine kinase